MTECDKGRNFTNVIGHVQAMQPSRPAATDSANDFWVSLNSVLFTIETTTTPYTTDNDAGSSSGPTNDTGGDTDDEAHSCGPRIRWR